MPDLTGKEQRVLDLSTALDERFKKPGISVGDNNVARCTALLSKWIVSANEAHGGVSRFPHGLLLLNGDPTQIQNFPSDLKGIPFLEVIPSDHADKRAAKLTWNESGTEARFSFTALAASLDLDTPKGTALWIDAIMVNDIKSKPVAILPLGDRIKAHSAHEVAATREGASQK